MMYKHGHTFNSDIIAAMISGTSLRQVMEDTLYCLEKKLEKWKEDIKKEYKDKDPFPQVTASLESEIALISGVVYGLKGKEK